MHKAAVVGFSELIRIAVDMGLTTKALLVIFSAILASCRAVCPHEDGTFENWSDPGTWDDGKVKHHSFLFELPMKLCDMLITAGHILPFLFIDSIINES